MIHGRHDHLQDYEPARFLAHYACNLCLIMDIQLFKEPVFSFLFFADGPIKADLKLFWFFTIIHLFGPFPIDFLSYSNSFGCEERIHN